MKRLLVTLAIMLVCVLIAGGFMPAQAMTQTPGTLPTPAATPTPTPTAQPEQTSGLMASGIVEWIGGVQDSQPMIYNDVWVGEVTIYQNYHGTLEGVVAIKYTVEINLLDGTLYSEVAGTFIGTVSGKQGSFKIKELGHGLTFSEDSGAMTCRYTILNGAGELSDLRGDINTRSSFDTTSIAGEYWGTLYFEK
jgi:hypothetical protein